MCHTVTRPPRFVNDKLAEKIAVDSVENGDPPVVEQRRPKTSGHQHVHERAEVRDLLQPLHQIDDAANVRAL